MSKPITPITDVLGDNYLVDAIVDDNTPLPDMVKAHLRHLLVASELGDLIVIQCISELTQQPAYMLCAHVLSSDQRSVLLPICELENTAHLMQRMRPPSALAKNAFATPAYTGTHVVDVIEDGNGTIMLAECAHDDGTKH